jgi:hypothetical protein
MKRDAMLRALRRSQSRGSFEAPAIAGAFSCVPSMFGSLEVQVLYPT